MSNEPHKMDDLDTDRPVYTRRIWLRALSGVSRVVVRVHSGAFLEANRRLAQTRSGPVQARFSPILGSTVGQLL